MLIPSILPVAHPEAIRDDARLSETSRLLVIAEAGGRTLTVPDVSAVGYVGIGPPMSTGSDASHHQ
ncbi:MAG: hypothetical protein Kow0074_03090 [Candidatus Zixiibacteriota bacterium]